MTKGKKILIAAIIIIGVLYIMGRNGNKKDDTFSTLQYPQNQIALINATVDAMSKSKKADNDMQKGNALRERSNAICSTIGSLFVKDWVGIISNIDSNSDGYGILSVEINNDISLKTWNNSVSDTFDNTLIRPGTKLFNTVSNLKRGQVIKFSGTFFADDQTCINESSLSLDGKLKEPEFIFRFSKVTPL